MSRQTSAALALPYENNDQVTRPIKKIPIGHKFQKKNPQTRLNPLSIADQQAIQDSAIGFALEGNLNFLKLIMNRHMEYTSLQKN